MNRAEHLESLLFRLAKGEELTAGERLEIAIAMAAGEIDLSRVSTQLRDTITASGLAECPASAGARMATTEGVAKALAQQRLQRDPISLRPVPVTEAQTRDIEGLRAGFEDVLRLLAVLPQSRYRSLAETALEEASMWAVKAVSHGPRAECSP